MLKWLLRTGTLIFALAFLGISVRAYWLMPRVSLTPLAPDQNFDRPTHMLAFPGDQSFAVAEKSGRIYRILPDSSQPSQLIADLRPLVYSEGWEEGLLSMAIDRNFDENHHFFVFYSLNSPLRSRIVRYTLGDDFQVLDGSDTVILELPKPHESHNGGMLAFGPDGYLYASIGESYVPKERRDEMLQSKQHLFGTIIRIDVSQATKNQPYQVPEDNPFVDEPDVRGEIFAYGLRNPWRFSFDRQTGSLYVGDVGSRHAEEINRIERGGNYGWPYMEGFECFAEKERCDQNSLIPPLASFAHQYLRSVTGGYVYRGEKLKFLKGRYVFGDYLRGIFHLPLDDEKRSNFYPNVLIPKLPTRFGPNRGRTRLFPSFAEDHSGELYAINIEGQIYRLDPIGWGEMIRGFLFMLTSFR